MGGGLALFGAETEYAFTPLDHRGRLVSRRPALERLLAMARARLPHLPDTSGSGFFLENASRLYIDSGLHPELSTPECTDPWSLVRQILAGERILADLAAAFEASDPDVAKALFFKCNVDYGGTGATWGCHESYLYRCRPELLPRQVIPHLVSRVVYTGAGGFNPLSPGLEFTLSPRVHHIDKVMASRSTEHRGIVHTKDEPLAARGYHRLHLICGESLCSETAMWLKAGTTALVVTLADAGVQPGEGVQLASALAALRTFSADPRCRATARLAGGASATAIEIQSHYLAQVESHLDLDVMPPWAPAVCRVWRDVLELLADAPDAASGVLDWGTKHALYAQRARRHGIAWDSLSHWTTAASRLHRALGLPSRVRDPALLAGALGARSPISPVSQEVARFLEERGLVIENLGAFLALRRELLETDTRFGQVGEGGVFAALDRAGALRHHVPGVDDIDGACTTPPQVGRARLRGEAVRRLASGDGCNQCDWDAVWNLRDRKVLDLREPFETEERWRPPRDEGEWPERSMSRMRGMRQRSMSRILRMLEEVEGAEAPVRERDRGAEAPVRERDRGAEAATGERDQGAEASVGDRDREAEAYAGDWVERFRRSRGL